MRPKNESLSHPTPQGEGLLDSGQIHESYTISKGISHNLFTVKTSLMINEYLVLNLKKFQLLRDFSFDFESKSFKRTPLTRVSPSWSSRGSYLRELQYDEAILCKERLV
jgi:hypothetical protein